MNHLKFGEFIKLKRKEKGILGTHISKTAKITRGSLFNIETNVNIPKLDTVLELLEAVGESLSTFSEYLKDQEKKMNQLELSGPRYKNYSTQEPCIVCGRLIEGGNTLHHLITQKNLGPDEDWNLMPLCTEHHEEVHKIGRTSFSGKYSAAKSWLMDHGWEYISLTNKWIRQC